MTDPTPEVEASRSSPAAPAAEVRDREADRKRFTDPQFNRWLDEGISDAGHTVWDQIGDVSSAWHGWANRGLYLTEGEKNLIAIEVVGIAASPSGISGTALPAESANKAMHRFMEQPDQMESILDKPTRVQLSRAKGWRMPPNTVKVDRTTKWGNPWTAENSGRVDPAIRFACETAPFWDVSALRGKNLACWCKPDASCHADVLLELANAGIPK